MRFIFLLLGMMSASVTFAAQTLNDTTRIYDLDEIIVVSQPKETVLMRRQPTSNSSFSTNEIEKLSVKSLNDISNHVPSLQIPSYGSRITSSIYVRGIGSRIGEPAMGLYYNNIPLVSKSAYNTHLYQIDRIDVLRGPQGTLYGMNAEGGIMRVYSKNPMTYQGTNIEIGTSIGLNNSETSRSASPAFNIEVAQYHRPSDKFAFSVSGFYKGNKGFYKNTNINESADLSNEAGGRAHLVWRPCDKLSMELSTDYQYVNENAFPYGEYHETSKSWNEPSTTIINGYKRNLLNNGLHIVYRLPDYILSSTSSWQWFDDLMIMDQDYLPADYMRLQQEQKSNALTQEFVIKTRNHSSWKHSSGLFFSYEWLHTNAPVYFGDDMNSMIKTQMSMPPMIASAISFSDNMVDGYFKTPRLNLGVYHESNIFVSERLMLTLGLRYDYQRTSIDYNTQANFRLAYTGMAYGQTISTNHLYTSQLINSTSDSYHELLPKIALTYRIDNRNSNIYATVSKGFRAGGYNLQMFSDIFREEQKNLSTSLMQLMKGDMNISHTPADYENINNTITYSPEESWNYELGAHLNLPNGIRADAAVYYTKMENQQLSIMADKYGYGRMMINADGSDTYGTELSLRGNAFADRFSWSATYSWTKATLENMSDAYVSSDEVSTKGNRIPFIPEHSFSLDADYRIRINRCKFLNSIALGANISGCGDIYWDVNNMHHQNFYALLGARVSFDLGKITIDIKGHNITNTKYNTFLVNSSVDGTDRTFSQRGAPTRFSLNLKMKL